MNWKWLGKKRSHLICGIFQFSGKNCIKPRNGLGKPVTGSGRQNMEHECSVLGGVCGKILQCILFLCLWIVCIWNTKFMIVFALRDFHVCKVHKAWNWTGIRNTLRRTGVSYMGSNAFLFLQCCMAWFSRKHRYNVTVHIVDLNWVWCYKRVRAVEQLCPRRRKNEQLCPRRRKEMKHYAHVEGKKWKVMPT